MIAKIEQRLKEVEALYASNAEELESLRIKYPVSYTHLDVYKRHIYMLYRVLYNGVN